MTLLIEFLNRKYDETEIADLLREDGVNLLERPKRQANGNLGIFLGWYELPGYKRQGPKFSEALEDELDVLYTYRYAVFDEHKLPEGIYEEEDIDHMSVQYGTDGRDGKLVSRVTIVSEDLSLIIQVYEDLRDGKLKPKRAWSSSSIPKAVPDEGTKGEGSGQHPLPRPAATATTPAAA